MAANLLYHRNEALQFLVLTDVAGAGTGGLSPQIDDVGPLFHQLQGQLRRLMTRTTAPLPEGIGRSIDNPHDEGR